MNTLKFLAFTLLLAALALGFSACGSDETNEPKLAAPVVVSTSPEKGSTTVEAGAISVTITYDKTITMTASDISKIQATGATISNVRTMSAALMLTATCSEEGKAVTITIPAGTYDWCIANPTPNDRAYFQLNGITAGDPTNPTVGINNFVLKFGDETNAIENLQSPIFNYKPEGWYTIDGRRLQGKPSRAGVYINNGKKVVIE